MKLEDGATLYRMAKAECSHGAGGAESRLALQRLRMWVLDHPRCTQGLEDLVLHYEASYEMRQEVRFTNEWLAWVRKHYGEQQEEGNDPTRTR